MLQLIYYSVLFFFLCALVVRSNIRRSSHCHFVHWSSFRSYYQHLLVCVLYALVFVCVCQCASKTNMLSNRQQLINWITKWHLMSWISMWSGWGRKKPSHCMKYMTAPRSMIWKLIWNFFLLVNSCIWTMQVWSVCACHLTAFAHDTQTDELKLFLFFQNLHNFFSFSR